MTELHEVLGFKARGERTTIVYRSGVRRFSCSYGELHLLSCKMVSFLEQHGVGRGGRVILWGKFHGIVPRRS